MNTREYAKLVHKVVPAEDFISLRGELCSGCGDCVVVCPVFLWKLERGSAKIEEDYRERCLECGACWQVCRSSAIDFDFPPGGTGITVRYG